MSDFSSLALGIMDLLPKECVPPFHAAESGDADFSLGCILDGDDRIVMVVDPARERFTDAATLNIAQAFVLAINTVLGHDTPPLGFVARNDNAA